MGHSAAGLALLIFASESAPADARSAWLAVVILGCGLL
jgi:hypothetical protein